MTFISCLGLQRVAVSVIKSVKSLATEYAAEYGEMRSGHIPILRTLGVSRDYRRGRVPRAKVLTPPHDFHVQKWYDTI